MTQYNASDMMRAYAEYALDLAEQLKVNLDFSEESLMDLNHIRPFCSRYSGKGLDDND
ncbi:hypothetical protein GCM10010911_06950 [Paenibacillus nasutitermitis]|uniref:Uncharacterized protein n=1 Tax=Paenibacillus nasutitermitis TaxID=1652958 RepID=A0A917DMV3_9BACL|nr:hypothetical protein GCM10010911_06950 [Paenibacillus nasutitermitis]